MTPLHSPTVMQPVAHALASLGNSPRPPIVSTGALRDVCRDNGRKV